MEIWKIVTVAELKPEPAPELELEPDPKLDPGENPTSTRGRTLNPASCSSSPEL